MTTAGDRFPLDPHYLAMNMRMLVLTLLASVAVSGCDTQTCTDAGCSHGATFRVAGTRDTSGGEWSVDLELDGELWSTTCRSDTAECDPFEGPDTPLVLEALVSNEGEIWVSFTADDADDLPTSYDISVASGDLIGGEAMGEFDYDTVHPNGPDCTPSCEYVEIEI